MLKKYILTLCFYSLLAQVFAQTPYPVSQPDKALPKELPEKKTKAEPKFPYGLPKDNIITLNLLSPIYGTIMVFYQHNLTSDNSYQVGTGFMSFDGFGSSNADKPHTTAFFLTPEFRYTLAGDHMNGTYVCPFVKYTNMTYSREYGHTYSGYYYPSTGASPSYPSYAFGYQTLGVGICLGQQTIFRNKISLEVFAGPVYNMLLDKTRPSYIDPRFVDEISDVQVDESINKINIKGYGVRAGLTVGFLF
jgi:hypothetical protein